MISFLKVSFFLILVKFSLEEIFQVPGMELSSFIKSDANYIVTFQAKWCPHSKKFIEEFKILDQYVQYHGIPIVLIQIDVDEPGVKEIYNLQETPSIYLFQNGRYLIYTGKKSSYALLTHIIDLIGLNIKEINSFEEIQNYNDKYEAIILYHSKDDQISKNFLKTLNENLKETNIFYCYTSNKQLFKELYNDFAESKSENENEKLILFRKFNEKIIEIDTNDNITQTINTISRLLIPKLSVFDHTVYSYIFKKRNSGIIFIFPSIECKNKSYM